MIPLFLINGLLKDNFNNIPKTEYFNYNFIPVKI